MKKTPIVDVNGNRKGSSSGWEAGIGEKSSMYYTRHYYHPEKGLELDVYWDKKGDGKHHATLYKNDELIKARKASTEKGIMKKANKIMGEFE